MWRVDPLPDHCKLVIIVEHMTTATTNYARDLSQALSSNKHLLRWVEKMAELTKPDSIHWVDGSQEENDSALRPDGGERDFYQAERGALAGLLLCALRCERCGSRGGPDVHLLAVERQRRADQQLGESV